MGSNMLHDTRPEPERACLIGVRVRRGQQPTWSIEDSLDELKNLARAANVIPVTTVIQHLHAPSPTYLGRGKLDEVREMVVGEALDVAIFDDELTPQCQRVLESTLKIKVIDRTALILDIFAERARTAEGKLQVAQAQMNYLLPRLAGQWSHLERLGGGIGTRGPGETQIETDRRLIQSRLKQIHKQLHNIQRTRAQQRERRVSSEISGIALFGYTNAGKSTLFNQLVASSEVLVKNQLFSTLDTTVRRIFLPSGVSVTVTDTIGLVNKLPHQLVKAFQSTLQEIAGADLILHVVDASSAHMQGQIKVAEDMLKTMRAERIPRILVLNKIDSVFESPSDYLKDRSDWLHKINVSPDEATVTVSATKGWFIPKLRDVIVQTLQQLVDNVSGSHYVHYVK